MKNLVSRFINDESGATAIEYGLIVALIAAAIITVVGLIGENVLDAFTAVNDGLEAEGI
jgi:pilus assembly protein Flp/PilA